MCKLLYCIFIEVLLLFALLFFLLVYRRSLGHILSCRRGRARFPLARSALVSLDRLYFPVRLSACGLKYMGAWLPRHLWRGLCRRLAVCRIFPFQNSVQLCFLLQLHADDMLEARKLLYRNFQSRIFQ